MEGRRRYTLTDVYNAARTERHFNYAFWMHITLDILGAYVMKYAGYSLVVMATSLVAIISVLGFFVLLPMLFDPWSFNMIVHSLWGTRLTVYGMNIPILTGVWFGSFRDAARGFHLLSLLYGGIYEARFTGGTA
jgi:ABC-type multidrug transport system permease subunit